MDGGVTTNSQSRHQELIVEEWTGSASTRFSLTATISPSSSSSPISIQRHGNNFGLAWRRFSSAFVPEGFPSSVTPYYLQFQVWDSLQGLSTYVRTMLSTQALLSAIGVGAKSATVIGATFQWFLRDLTGMLGDILFTFDQGSNLDNNAKMWRLVVGLMNDLGMLMDLLSPLFPSAILFIVCLGSLSRSFRSYYKKAMYLLLLKRGTVAVVMQKDSTPANVLEAFIHALVMLKISDKKGSPHFESWSWMEKNYKEYLTKLRLSGWKTATSIACCNLEGKLEPRRAF